MPRYAIVSLLTLLLAMASCSKRQSATERAAQEGVLLLGNGEEPSSLDPHIATSVAEAHILYSLFEGLVSPDPDNPNDIAPGVASSWIYSPEEKSYRFTLRPDARWSDGSPVTADDFKRSVQRALDPKFATAYPEMFFDIRNAKDYYLGKIDSFESVGLKALSDHQLEIALGNLAPNFLNKLKHFAWLPAPIRTLESLGDWKSRSTRWTTPQTMVSNGPFILETWSPSSVIEVKRNASYWDDQNVLLNKIRFFPYENAQLESRAFRSKQLHATDKIPVEELGDPLDEEAGQRFDPFLATSYLIFNTSSPQLANLEFRKALALAIDKESLVANINRSGRAASSFTPAGLASYTPPVSSQYEPNEARRVFEKTFPDGSAAPKLTFTVSNIPASRAIAEAIQSMWSETLGLEIELLNMEAKSLFSSLTAGDFEVSYLLWSGDYEDPVSFLGLWSSRNSANRARWENASFDNLLENAAAENDPSARLDLLSRAESILLEQTPIVPLIWRTKNFYLDSSVTNWPPALLDMRSYKRVGLLTQ